jgi:hypothetical protein
MQQNLSWKTDSRSFRHEIYRWNPKIHYRLYKVPQHNPILRQLNPVHTLLANFLKSFYFYTAIDAYYSCLK